VGDAISFVTEEDHGELRTLERFIGRGIVRKKAEGFNYSAAAPPFNPAEERERRPQHPPRGQHRPQGHSSGRPSGHFSQARPPQGGGGRRPQFSSRPPQGARPPQAPAHGNRPQPAGERPPPEPNGNREGGNERHFPSTTPKRGFFRRRFGR
jgi:ATP-dependent RNA helicase RhlE